ncbi:MAG: stage II sporulation protein D [Oscillospiraceae bacterium]|nr:stage II sporulation protein D [Oscillospiraceae bacterium]
MALLIIPMIAINMRDMGPPENEAVIHTPIISSPVIQDTDVPEQDGESEKMPAVQAPELPAENENAARQTAGTENGVLSFRILDESTGKVNDVSLRDYVRGAVASEMPVSFHMEALKAQAVAAHTYALHQHYTQQKNPDPALKGADFSADPANMLVYSTEERVKAFYGEPYADAHWNKICEAADSVLPYIMEYEDEPIVAAYHAMSAGMTEAAENVWSGRADYLLPAESVGDYLAPDYETRVNLSADEVKSALLGAYPSMDLSGKPGGWFSDIVRSDSGYITEIDVGGVLLHGKDIRTLFGLRSHNMDIFYTDQGFSFAVYGHGHGVGLSQYGADFLARQGYTFDQILENYYSGVTLKQIMLNAD